jgi:hypothetical protein
MRLEPPIFQPGRLPFVRATFTAAFPSFRDAPSVGVSRLKVQAWNPYSPGSRKSAQRCAASVPAGLSRHSCGAVAAADHAAADFTGRARLIRSRSRGEFMASRKSPRRCTLSQNSGPLPNTRARISAVEAVTLRRALLSSLTCLRCTPVALRQCALRQAHRRHGLLDQNFVDARRLALRRQHGSPHRVLWSSGVTPFASPRLPSHPKKRR